MLKKDKIKTKMFDARISPVVPATSHLEEPRWYWDPQQSITVIGFQLNPEVIALNEFDSGHISVEVDVSLVPKMVQDGSLYREAAAIFYRSGTVGIGVSEVIFGEMLVWRHLFFPEGKGVDLDAGDFLYINTFHDNTMANNQEVKFRALIYYLER